MNQFSLSPSAANTPRPPGGENQLPSGRTTGAGEEANPLASSPANLSRIIREVLAMRAEQAARFGHTPERDRQQPLYRFGVQIAQRAADVREDAQFNRTANMRLRLVKLAALALAALERIDSEAAAPPHFAQPNGEVAPAQAGDGGVS